MATLFRRGLTLEQIGKKYGCSRQYVHQCIGKIGIRGTEGGISKRAAERRESKRIERDERSQERWGCSFDEYIQIRSVKNATKAYRSQKREARKRGIGWELTLAEWWNIWSQSGRWNERGRGQGYVMCRKGDVGPYAVGNVFIASARENSSQTPRKNKNIPMGVMKHRHLPGYVAQRMINGKTAHLGRFIDPEEAHRAYLRAAPQGSAERRVFEESELYRLVYSA